jgi:hypothetical protein
MTPAELACPEYKPLEPIPGRGLRRSFLAPFSLLTKAL